MSESSSDAFAPSRRIQMLLRAMRVALHVTVAALLVVGVVRCWQEAVASGSWSGLGVALALAVVFAAVYVAGTVVEKRRGAGAAGQIVVRWQLPWLVVVTLLWVGLVATFVDFAWLVFPLFFLHLHVVGQRSVPAALGCVLGLTAVVLVAYAVHRDGLDVGAVIGPVIGALVAVVMSAAYALFYDEARRQQRIIAELEATRADLAAAERRAGALRERQRWAREVHDTVAQGLASVVLLSRAAQESLAGAGAQAGADADARADARAHTPAGAREGDAAAVAGPTPDPLAGQLAQMERTAVHSLQQARALVDQADAVTPDRVPVHEIAAELAELCETTQATARQSGAPLVVRFNGPDEVARGVGAPGVPGAAGAGAPAERTVSTESATVLRRVAQSALSNVLLHAAAAHCVVTFTLYPDGCSLDIHDDGRGRSGQPSGFGMETMRQRAAEVGGTLTVEDGSPGTVVALNVPDREVAGSVETSTARSAAPGTPSSAPGAPGAPSTSSHTPRRTP